MQKYLLFLLLSPLITTAQSSQSNNSTNCKYKGIKFKVGLTWQQILDKAKAENKYVFVDCYTTWCGPCKMMDRNVYLNEKVGDYMNKNFISVKVQIDTSINDNEEIRRWYADARTIQVNYNVTSFPSFLFFTPQGNIIHRDLGAKNPDNFITAASNAVNPSRQYCALLENYKRNKKDYTMMPYLVNMAKIIGDKNMANRIAKDYRDNYLNKQSEDKLLTKENIQFLCNFIPSINDKGFHLFYKYSNKIDEIMGQKGLAQSMVDNIITKEEIDQKLWNEENKPITRNPNWARLIMSITKRFKRSYAERTVLDAQLRWYEYKKDWQKVVKYNIEKVDKYGLDTSGLGKYALNNMVFNVIFMHANDKAILNKGIQWMEVLLKIDSNRQTWLDTYANLLYKIGRKEEALIWEEKAFKLEENEASKWERNPDKSYQETLLKMKKGDSTWANK